MWRLDYGFTGYQVPVVPRAPRSARGRGRIRKKCEDNQKRGFEVLSSVAGNLSQESESSVPTNVACVQDLHHIVYANSNREREAEGRSLKEDPCQQGNCVEKFFAFLPSLQGLHKSYKLNEFCHGQNNLILEVGSESGAYDQSERIFFAEKLATVNSRNNCGSSSNSVVGDSPCFGEFFEDKVGGVLEGKLGEKSYASISEKYGIIPVTGEDLIKLDRKPCALVGLESDVKPSLLDCINHVPGPKHHDNVKVACREDDKNSVWCTQHSTISKTYTPTAGIRERRTNKLSASRHWREAQNLKDGKMKPMYCNGTCRHMDNTSQNIYPFKKRKFFSQSPPCTSDGGDNHSTAIEESSSVAGQVPLESKGCNVKLSIKSFKVPELSIEIPATATIGSLKRTVMEAVTAILGGGLHVGIMLQGKKVKDDNKTLLQTGISQDQKRHRLGFILEPRRAQLTPPACTEDQSLLPGCRPQKLSRHSAPFTLQPETPAMVAIPSIGMEALAVVPFHRKSHPEFVQRRIRRPFSALEVEALVQAVEKLGTGRWRDIKLRAFDSEKHRTYVDLKDKWKTLVHTATISPQQRRGEPVPQELLDRVLAAHAYWSTALNKATC